jgi:hypothetical protein
MAAPTPVTASVSAVVSQTPGSDDKQIILPSGDQKQETANDNKTVDNNDVKQIDKKQEAIDWLNSEADRTGDNEIFLTMFSDSLVVQIYRKLADGNWLVSNNRPAFDLYGPLAEKHFPFREFSENDIKLVMLYKNSGTPSRDPSEFMSFEDDY